MKSIGKNKPAFFKLFYQHLCIFFKKGNMWGRGEMLFFNSLAFSSETVKLFVYLGEVVL